MLMNILMPEEIAEMSAAGGVGSAIQGYAGRVGRKLEEHLIEEVLNYLLSKAGKSK